MNRNQRLIAGLAYADLRHEWILSVCMILSIAAILAPLLVLLGLKYGFIENMRADLVEDPVNREIRPARTLNLKPEWFSMLRKREEVSFVIPTILRGSSVVKVMASSGAYQFMDIIPTAVGDPLLLGNQGIVPKPGQCVLSLAASEQLKIKAGQQLQLKITRTRKKKRQFETVKLQVVAVLSARADALDRIYVDYHLANDIEIYRDGFAVDSRHWPGSQPYPFLSYDGVWVLSRRKLDRLAQRLLTINTGLTHIESRTRVQFFANYGFAIPDQYFVYQLKALNQIQFDSVNALINKLRGNSAIVIPYINNNLVTNEKNEFVKIVGISLSPRQSKALELPFLPWGKLSPQLLKNQIMLPKDSHDLTYIAQVKDKKIALALNNVGQSFSAFALVPVELLGVLKTASQRKVIYHKQRQTFMLGKADFRGFRLYSKSIDDVPKLYHYLRDMGIDVLANVQEIEKVKMLDDGLTKIFWLVAMIGIIGGIAALIASLYAAVERKQKELSVLRLMGMRRLSVFQFPIFQALFLALSSVLIAFASFQLLAVIINWVFAEALKSGQSICLLPMHYYIISLLLTLFIALAASLLAAIKTTQIDPSEAIREE